MVQGDTNSGNNGYNLSQNYRSYPNVYREPFLNQNNLKRPLYLDVRNDWSGAEDVEIINMIDKCPNIFVKIQGVKTEAAIDTGSKITCISENFFVNNKNKFKNCKILPIFGTSVMGAMGVKPIKLKH